MKLSSGKTTIRGAMQDLLVRALKIVGGHPDPKVNTGRVGGIPIFKLPKTRAKVPKQLRHLPLTRVAAG